MMPLPNYFIHDEDGKAVQVDLTKAVSDGVEVLTVSYSEERHCVDVKLQSEANTAERMAVTA